MRKILLLVFTTILSLQAGADVLQDFDGLGDNKDLLDKAKALNPDVAVTVVQERIVQRRNRLEIAPEIGKVLGGENYLNTYGYGANLHYHITPRWSVGARYTYYTNQLSSEGKSLIGTSKVQNVADIDEPKNAYMGFVNWYPIYGKLNLFGKGVTHFDVYATAGYGNIELRRGGAGTWTAGGGVGFWFSQHMTSRIEARYQNYTASRENNTENSLNSMVLSLQVGYML